MPLPLYLHTLPHRNNTGSDIRNAIHAHQAGAAFPNATEPSFWVVESFTMAEDFDSAGKKRSCDTFILIRFNLFPFKLKSNSSSSLEFENGMVLYTQIVVQALLLHMGPEDASSPIGSCTAPRPAPQSRSRSRALPQSSGRRLPSSSMASGSGGPRISRCSLCLAASR